MASTPDRRARALAARQHGILTLLDALACGLTARQVELRVSSGAWIRVARGVYRIAGTPVTWRQQAYAAQRSVAGAGGVVSHVTALALHGLATPSSLPHVTVPPGRRAACPIAKVHRAVVAVADQLTIDGIRCTSPSRVLVDMAALVDRPALEAWLDAMLCGGLASEASVLSSLARAGGRRRGRDALRSVLEIWTGGIEPGSPAEVRLLRRLVEWGFPRPITQFEVALPGDRVVRVDAAWPQNLVALEYEGRAFHGPRRTAPDEARYAALRRLGWTVVPADKHDLLPGERRLPG